MSIRSLIAFILPFSVIFPCITGAAPNPFEREIALYEKLDVTSTPPDGSALFVGSSSIKMWRTIHKDLAPLTVTNRGFGGSSIADCTYFIPRIVTPYHPGVILLYAGDNDLAAGKSPEQVLADFKAFVSECRKTMPQTPIQFISIKPSPARWNLWEKTRKANDLIKQHISGQKGLAYIDIATPMLDQQGNVRGDLFLSDRLHMNAEGYRIWTSAIKPKLTESLKAVKQYKPSARELEHRRDTAPLKPR